MSQGAGQTTQGPDLAMLQLMLDHIPYVVSTIDRQRRLVWVNKLSAAEQRQVVGHRIDEFVQPAHVAEAASAIERAFISSAPTRFQSQGLIDGRPSLWYDNTVVPLPNGDTRAQLAMLLGVDITQQRLAEQALKDSERRFRMVTETSPDTILIVDRDHRVVYLNRDPPPESGATRADLLGRRIEELTHASDVSGAEQTIERALLTGESGTYEVRGGVSGRDYVNRVMRLPGDDSSPLAMVTATDVTEQRRTESKRVALQAQLQQSQKLELVGQLAGGVAHDFNNVLLVIRSHLDFAISAAEAGEDVLAELQTIAAAAERASDMTRRLLSVGRRANHAPAHFDLAQFARATMQLLDRMMPESIEVEFEAMDGPFPIFADPAQLEQVLINICLNARDAIAGVGKIRVSIEQSVSRTASGIAHCYALRVADTGHGMSEETVRRIFEPFFTTKAPGKGTGLGLSMVHGIVTENGGRVEVKSEPGRGTTFSVLLPRAGERVVEAVSFAPSERARPEGAGTILLAEDEAEVRSVVVRILERAGYHVIEAENGRRAVELFEQRGHSIDLVLLDALMPVLGGKETYDEIVRIRADIPVLFTSGYVADTLSKSFLADRGLEVLTKPFRPATLLGAVHKALASAASSSSVK